MLRGKVNLFLILAVISGLVAAYGVYTYLGHLKATYRSTGDFRTVVVARAKIPPQTKITEEMLEVKEMPSAYIHKEALAERGEAVGKITTTVIYPGEQILKTKIAGLKDSSQGLAFLVSPGKRAATIAVNDVSGIAGLLRPGDKVDVTGTVDVPSGGSRQTVTSLLIQNVNVLAVNQSTDANPNPVKGGHKSLETQTVTLEVTPQQAQMLILASERGAVRLLLRSPGDGAEVDIPSARLDNLVR
ncbi:Flp pilus assembly protein CpaB [Desulfofundulus sp.]|uniref:Flp pilus assembly protein CpaB n=1 Tax=Desulfofundulus sp. TaxID=2282750 RepID=UPI003C72504E